MRWISVRAGPAMAFGMGLVAAVAVVTCVNKKEPVEDPNRPILIRPTLPLAIPGLKGHTIQTLCVNVKKYGKDVAPDAKASLEFRERTIAHVLALAGVSVVGEHESCEGTLNVWLSSEALGAPYTDHRFHFTGARAEGRVTLSIAGLPAQSFQIEDEIDVARSVLRDAGLDEASTPEQFEAMSVALLKGLTGIWGADLLVRLLQHGTPHSLAINPASRGEELGRVFGSLGLRAMEDASAKLMPLLGMQDVDNDAVRSCLKTLGKPAVGELAAVLKGNNFEAVHQAIEALDGIGPDAWEAVPALIGILRGEAAGLREDSARALLRICEPRSKGGELRGFGEDADRWQDWWDQHK